MNWIFFFFFFPEKVSTPKILWSCGNQSLTCEITSGTDPTLMLYVNQTMIKNLLNMTIVQWNWTSQQEMTVSCTAKNEVSQKREEKIINCSGAWQALVRHSELTSQIQPASSRAETCSA